MLKEKVQNNYGNASFPKFLWAVRSITEAVWSPTRLTKRLLIGLLQLPSGNSCTAAGGHFREFLKIFSAKNRKRWMWRCVCALNSEGCILIPSFSSSKEGSYRKTEISAPLIYVLSLRSLIIFSISLLFQGFLPSADANVWQAVYSPRPSLSCCSHFSLQPLCGLDFIWSFPKSRFSQVPRVWCSDGSLNVSILHCWHQEWLFVMFSVARSFGQLRSSVYNPLPKPPNVK